MATLLATPLGFGRQLISMEESKTASSFWQSSSWLSGSWSCLPSRSDRCSRQTAPSALPLLHTHHIRRTSLDHYQIACMLEPRLVPRRLKKRPTQNTCGFSFYIQPFLRTLVAHRFSWNLPAIRWRQCWDATCWGCSWPTRSSWVGLVGWVAGSSSSSCPEGLAVSSSSSSLPLSGLSIQLTAGSRCCWLSVAIE